MSYQVIIYHCCGTGQSWCRSKMSIASELATTGYGTRSVTRSPLSYCSTASIGRMCTEADLTLLKR